MTISSENHEEFSKNFSIKNGEKISQKVELVTTSQYALATIVAPLSPEEKILRQDDIVSILGADYKLVARDSDGVFWIVKSTNSGISVGVFEAGKFKSKMDFPHSFVSYDFDFFGNIFIFSNSDTEKTLITKDFKNIFPTKITEKIKQVRFENNEWSVASDDKIFTYKNNNWQENLRFTDFADFGKWRVGYISENAKNLLSLGNYDPKQ